MSNDSESTSLENHFLIAMPQMQDPYFANTVTYVWKHNAEGALGIVINKPLRACIADIFDELDIICSIEDNPFHHQHVLAGGPVERDKGFILHDSGLSWESSIAVTENVAICTSKTILQDIAAGSGPQNYLIALGCAGWDAGQLEQEIIANSWITAPAKTDVIFSRDHHSKLNAASAILGIDLNKISPAAGHS